MLQYGCDHGGEERKDGLKLTMRLSIARKTIRLGRYTTLYGPNVQWGAKGKVRYEAFEAPDVPNQLPELYGTKITPHIPQPYFYHPFYHALEYGPN